MLKKFQITKKGKKKTLDKFVEIILGKQGKGHMEEKQFTLFISPVCSRMTAALSVAQQRQIKPF